MYAIDISDVKQLDSSKLKAFKLPDELNSSFQAILEDVRNAANSIPDSGRADNSPEKLYAEIMVNGKTVAKVYNSGCAEMPNSIGNLLLGEFSEQMDIGPQLAQIRAERIAEELGGTIVTAKTAQNQSEWQKTRELELFASESPHADAMDELMEFLRNLRA